MRLGWDHDLLNAPEIACVAVNRGVQLITVHGRTRCQFYKGQADWSAIANTVLAVDVPVIANGDIHSVEDAVAAKSASGAFGVMIGRAAMGQPWLIGEIAARFEGVPYECPSLEQQFEGLCAQISDSQTLYGDALGMRIVRKHIAAHVDKVALPLTEIDRRALRAELCQIEDSAQLFKALERLYSGAELRVAA